jgi:hypothetical protein
MIANVKQKFNYLKKSAPFSALFLGKSATAFSGRTEVYTVTFVFSAKISASWQHCWQYKAFGPTSVRFFLTVYM